MHARWAAAAWEPWQEVVQHASHAKGLPAPQAKRAVSAAHALAAIHLQSVMRKP